MLAIHQIINSPVPSNCFVMYDKAVGRECIVVDPGSKNDDELFAFLEEDGLVPQYIVLTHEHFDHCWGVNEFVEKYKVPIICTEHCSDCIKYEKKNCSVFYDNNERFVINSPAISVEELNYVLSFVGAELRFFLTPGHTDSSICFTLNRNLFTGDTLIKDLRTVTKLPTGSMVKLKESIELLRALQGKGYTVYPGHGDVFELDGYDLELMIKGGLPR